MTTRESEWSDEDVAWMEALAEWRASRCPHCGRDLAECTDPSADGAYTVPPPTRCHAATALEIAAQAYREQPQPGALLWRAERRR